MDKGKTQKVSKIGVFVKLYSVDEGSPIRYYILPA